MSRSVASRTLTTKERVVIAYIADGFSNADIGKVMFVQEDTVKAHVRRICNKLGARNRTHAVSIAYMTGILAVPTTERAQVEVSVTYPQGLAHIGYASVQNTAIQQSPVQAMRQSQRSNLLAQRDFRPAGWRAYAVVPLTEAISG